MRVYSIIYFTGFESSDWLTDQLLPHQLAVIPVILYYSAKRKQYIFFQWGPREEDSNGTDENEVEKVKETQWISSQIVVTQIEWIDKFSPIIIGSPIVVLECDHSVPLIHILFHYIWTCFLFTRVSMYTIKSQRKYYPPLPVTIYELLPHFFNFGCCRYKSYSHLSTPPCF